MYDISFDLDNMHQTVEEADEELWYIGCAGAYNPDEWIDDDAPVIVKKSKFKTKGNGCTCTKCGEIFPFAEPNQPDDSFKCWSCRNY